MPGRHSLFWKLAIILVGFCLVMIALTLSFGQMIGQRTSFLSDDARQVLRGYAQEAELAWKQGGAAGVDAFQASLEQREGSWALLLDSHLFPLGSRAITDDQRQRLSFMRRLEWPMGRQSAEPRTLSIPFDEGRAQLVMLLPERFSPWGPRPVLFFLAQKVVPGLLALLLCLLLYRLLISPLRHLREQANALRGDQLSTRVAPSVSRRRDELGELARAFDHMAGRLENTVSFQRQLLRDLSHELRTPLSRLRVAGESELDVEGLRQRLEREVQSMQQLVDDTLELVWLDTERPQLPLEEIEVRSLWGVICENACYESGWPARQLVCELGPECRVLGNLNGFAQALENILRNAIRHSPPGGVIRLGGQLQDGYWELWLEDQGGGVGDGQLETIFRPFTRLCAARPGGEGFGLGLAIARGAMRSQGGDLWAENTGEGLRLNLRLATV